MKIQVPKSVYNSIKASPAGKVPRGIVNNAKGLTNPKTYLGTEGDRLGVTYKKYGPVSIMSKQATPASKKQAIAIKRQKTDSKKRK